MELDLPEKRYYTIGEVAKAFEVNTSLLRYWEKQFKEIQPKKKTSGVRKYTPQDVENIKLIYHLLKEKGMTIEGTKKSIERFQEFGRE
jgi:DNA-binding transcriptional MerR regulator